MRAVLGMPDGLEAFSVISLGYPKAAGRQQDRYEESWVHWERG